MSKLCISKLPEYDSNSETKHFNYLGTTVLLEYFKQKKRFFSQKKKLYRIAS